MWSIGEVKRKGNWAFKKNYWKTVVVAFILSLLVSGGIGSFNYSAGGNPFKYVNNNSSTNSSQNVFNYSDDGNDIFGNGYSGEYNENDIFSDDFSNDFADEFKEEFGNIDSATIGIGVATIMIWLVVFFVIFVIIMAISITLDVLVFNPIQVGTKSFFLKNLNTNADVKEMLSGFDKGSYKNMIKVMFFMKLYTFLWTLLLIIPGIIKRYEYRMIPYIMAENPEMPMEQAFHESKKLMNGHKFNAFLLDLSFIGWHILSAFTFGILAIFYVSPYKHSTDAVLYETLKYGNGNVVYTEPAVLDVN